MKPYSESLPCPALHETVECFWSHASGAHSLVHRVLPDGCLDLLVTTAEGGLHGYVIGSMSAYIDVAVPPSAMTAGIRFRPGQAARHLRLPLGEIRDRRIDLEAAFGGKARRWMDAAVSGREAEIWRETLALVGEARQATPVQQAAAWTARNGAVRLEAMQQSVWLSERQFRRRFLQEAGIGAKQYLRVMRMQRALAALRHETPTNLAVFASEHGFYDQAHCTNEFRELTGRSPSEWLLRQSP